MTAGKLLPLSASLCVLASACDPPPPDMPPVRTVVAMEAYRSALDSVRTLLRPIAARGVGIAVAVQRGDSVLWVEGIGTADAKGPDPLHPYETLFRVYSLAKPMTAAAGARLMEAGQLDPAAPVQRYVPSFPEKSRPVTVMELATHQSGIRHYQGGEAQSDMHCETVQDALRIFADDPLLEIEPGSESYSSWGFVLLSATIESAAGEPFPEAMRSLVLDPAAMSRTPLGAPDIPLPRAAALAESPSGVVPADPVDNSCKWGAGAYLSTAPDIARFGVAMFDGTLLSPPSAQLFLQGADTYRAQGIGSGGTAFLSSHAPSGTSLALLANVSGESLGPALQEAFAVMVELFTSP